MILPKIVLDVDAREGKGVTLDGREVPGVVQVEAISAVGAIQRIRLTIMSDDIEYRGDPKLVAALRKEDR